MNERFLFRGKAIHESAGGTKVGDWAFGGYTYEPYIGKEGGDAFILPDMQDVVQVDPAAVGQCTGLRDKNGTLIFEGDSVKLFINGGEDIGLINYKNGSFFVESRNWNIVFSHLPNLQATLEVIGNIHDNPELLKGDETK